jgi:hypothetical protein
MLVEVSSNERDQTWAKFNNRKLFDYKSVMVVVISSFESFRSISQKNAPHSLALRQCRQCPFHQMVSAEWLIYGWPTTR